MRETQHVPIKQNKTKKSAFLNAGGSYTLAKNLKFRFQQSWPSLFSDNMKIKPFGLWLTGRAKLTNQKLCLWAKEFPKRITPLSRRNFSASPPPLTLTLMVTYSLGTNIFLSLAFHCCRNKKHRNFYLIYL